MKKDKNTCNYCRFCQYNNDHHCFICHNEKSEKYGKELDDSGSTVTCEKFSAHRIGYIPYKEAMYDVSRRISHSHFKLPDNDNKKAYLILEFDTNEELIDYKDSLLSLIKRNIMISAATNIDY